MKGALSFKNVPYKNLNIIIIISEMSVWIVEYVTRY